MRKGDEKKQEMLAVAERLFCLKGYEATSVQDILDVLHISKGGFYHHFASKEVVLECLFTRRAENALRETEELLEAMVNPLQRLNTALKMFLPLRREDKAFMAMLLPLIERQEGRSMRLCFQESLEEAFLPLMEREIDLAMQAEVIMPPVHDCAHLLLHLLSKCWQDAAMHLLDSARKNQEHSPAALLGILEQYRRTVEVLLDAPYGSVNFADLKEWDALSEVLMRRMMLPMQG
ncbi:MAG: TetR/AcrR family transcriptional regulator [Clostridia bacterium]|nr:TetR/AcrR family transcriptional regulator [Clostridia bacterium]